MQHRVTSRGNCREGNGKKGAAIRTSLQQESGAEGWHNDQTHSKGKHKQRAEKGEKATPKRRLSECSEQRSVRHELIPRSRCLMRTVISRECARERCSSRPSKQYRRRSTEHRQSDADQIRRRSLREEDRVGVAEFVEFHHPVGEETERQGGANAANTREVSSVQAETACSSPRCGK